MYFFASLVVLLLVLLLVQLCNAKFSEQLGGRTSSLGSRRGSGVGRRLDNDDDGDDATDFLGFHTVATMPYACSDMSATTFERNYGDGQGHRIYLVGGCTMPQQCVVADGTEVVQYCYCPELTSRTIYFTPDTEQWHEDCAAAPRDRYRHMAVRVQEYLYLLGGRDIDDNIILAVDRYNTATDSWDSPFVWPDAVSDAAAFYANGKIYVAGGFDAGYSTLSQLLEIDPDDGAVNTDLPSMYLGRADLQVMEFGDNEFWVVGGWNAETSDGFCHPSRDVEVFDAETLQWRNESQLENGRGDLVLGNMGSALFAVGGETKNESSPNCSFSIPVRIVERHLYDSENWNDEEDIPADLFRFSGASFRGTDPDDDFADDYNEFSQAIYLFGGQGLYDETSHTYPVLDSTIKYIPSSTEVRKKSSNDDSDDKTLDAGGIAGVVIAGIVIAIIVGACVIAFLEYKRRGNSLLKNDESAPQPVPGAEEEEEGVEMSRA